MMDPNSLAKEFMCPICNMLPFDPVIAEDGFVYDKECIGKFIAIGRSPMTGEQMGATLISSISVRETIQVLAQCVGIDTALLGAWPKKQENLNDFSVTKTKAVQGDVEHIMILAKWYLFGDKDGIDRDAKLGYEWCERAADLDNSLGKAYQGVCLVCGLGVERDFEEGNDLLVEAASQEVDDEARGKSISLQNCRFSCNTSVSNRRFILHLDAHFFTDFAAFHLGCFYKHGKYGFRLITKKAQKWFAKVQSKPTQFMFDSTGGSILEHERLSEPLLLFQTSVSESIERNSIEHDEVSSSTATTISSSKHSSSTNSLDYEQRNYDGRKCDKCSGKIAASGTKSIAPKLCASCKVIGSGGGGGRSIA
jgi:hypothetical protein